MVNIRLSLNGGSGQMVSELTVLTMYHMVRYRLCLTRYVGARAQRRTVAQLYAVCQCRASKVFVSKHFIQAVLRL